MTYDEQREAEVNWYKEHGQFPDRIGMTRERKPYVVPDFLWNRRRENLSRREYIDQRMNKYVLDQHYGWKA